MIKEFFMPDASHGFYIQYRVMNFDKKCRRHFPVSKFWSDKDIASINSERVYFFSPAFRDYGKNTVIGSYVAWADFDNVKAGEIDYRGFSPSLEISSGGGVHAYWRFTDFVSVDDLQFVLGLVVERLGSDVLARDVTRFMRVPKSFNHKFVPPRFCYVLARGDDYDYKMFVRGLLSLSSIVHTHTPSPLLPCPRVKLFRRGNENGDFWFWQKSQPYAIGEGEIIEQEFDGSIHVSVSVLGGREVVWAGHLGEVPESLRGYLSEIRFLSRD